MYPLSTTATTFLVAAAYFTSCLTARDATPLKPLLRSRDQIFGPQFEYSTFTEDRTTSPYHPTAITPTQPPPVAAWLATTATAGSEAADLTDPTRFRITKTQLESLLSLALETFTLEVVSDEKPDTSMTGDHQHQPVRVLGKIPIHLRVKELQIGGVSIPRLQTESVNAEMDGVNYGNLRV
ncbi:hypothetical protein BGZ68_009228 [Mortierella alpina]|nr:hypothetical protein BGZ68_009228 [Mortierella alpina]